MNSRLGSCLVVAAVLASLAVGCTNNITPCDDGVVAPPSASATSSPESVSRAWTSMETNAARGEMARAYRKDPAGYWAVHGLPALARSADIRAHDQVPAPDAIFADVMTAFDASAFGAACERSLVHPDLCERALAGGDAEAGLPGAVRAWVAAGDARTGTGAGDELATRGLREVLETSFVASKLAALAPPTTKTAERLPQVMDVACSPPVGPGPIPGAPTWVNVGYDPKLSGDKPDGMCVTKAVGLCTHRLGRRTATVTPEAWQGLSSELGALPTGGAHIADIRSYFKDNGYAFAEAWDGPRESATAEARAALARGCDVFLWYDAGTVAHIEVVTDVSADGAAGATVTTNSWGHTATVNVDSGAYSAKSDLATYPPTFNPTGNATLYYACANE